MNDWLFLPSWVLHPVATARGSVPNSSIVRFADSTNQNIDCVPPDEIGELFSVVR
jgi:hypothetical protein